jgi:hypothetical protein
MRPLSVTAANAFWGELEKIAAYVKEARKIDVPGPLKGLVTPEMGPKSFRRILEGYRTGLKGTSEAEGRFVRDKGFLTHDAFSGGGPEAMESILRQGYVEGSLGGSGTAQYTRPGVREVYWHRGIPGVDRNDDGTIAKEWFKGQGTEGLHVDQGRLHRLGLIAPDSVHRTLGRRAPQIARTAPYELQPGDLAVLSAKDRKNLPAMLGHVKDRDMRWADTSMQQEALKHAVLERYLKQKGLLDVGDSITDLDNEDFADILEQALEGKKKGSLPRNLRWWRSAKAPTTSNLEAEFMRRIRAPYS